VHDLTALDTSIGTWIADLPTADIAVGSVIFFTIFWTGRNAWEGRDFQIAVTT
jgi:glucoamylase